MGFFKPQSARILQRFFNEVCKKWDRLSDEEKESGNFINPDEPVVLRCENPEYDQDFDDENDSHFYYHIKSVGGGTDCDVDGNECGHDGAQIGGFEIQDGFYWNGRRHEK